MRHVSTIGIVLATVMVASAVFAQTPPKVFVYPNKGQSKDQQSKDTAACQQSANEQAPPSQAPTGPGTHAGGTVGGAAKGAAVAFYDFLGSPAAAAIFRRHGFLLSAALEKTKL